MQLTLPATTALYKQDIRILLSLHLMRKHTVCSSFKTAYAITQKILRLTFGSVRLVCVYASEERTNLRSLKWMRMYLINGASTKKAKNTQRWNEWVNVGGNTVSGCRYPHTNTHAVCGRKRGSEEEVVVEEREVSNPRGATNWLAGLLAGWSTATTTTSTKPLFSIYNVSVADSPSCATCSSLPSRWPTSILFLY